MDGDPIGVGVGARQRDAYLHRLPVAGVEEPRPTFTVVQIHKIIRRVCNHDCLSADGNFHPGDGDL